MLLRFLRNHDASVAPMLALAALPLFGFAGAAIDFSRAAAARSSMQAALDSTALMLSKDAATAEPAQLQTKGSDYFKAMFNRPDVAEVSFTTSYNNVAGSEIVVTAGGTVKANFMGVIGYPTMHIGSTATVKWGNTKLRISLVLDNTGSMASDGKLTALKTATKNLITQLKDAAVTDGDVYVSIVPFVKDVNVGASNRDQLWIDWSDWDDHNGTCSKSGYSSKDSCTSHGTCSKNYSSQSKCVNNGGTWTPATWTSANHNTWNGCVTDRGNSNSPSSGNYDTNVEPPKTGILASLFPAEQYSSCPQGIMPLNYNWSGMTTLVNGMVAAGNTNQAIGLAHGWMSLVGGGPYPTPPAEDPRFKYKHVIILLTDGLNTENRWYSSASSIDAREQLTCTNIKAADITLYTVQVNTGGDPTSTLLKNCATSTDKFFLLTNANQIVTTFQQIGTQLSNLRIAK